VHSLLNATTPTSIHPLSLHDALPIYFFRGASQPPTKKNLLILPVSTSSLILAACLSSTEVEKPVVNSYSPGASGSSGSSRALARSEEHTSELQSRENLVCRLLLEKKK